MTSQKIKEEIQEVIKEISNVSIQGYLIKKTQKRKILEKFTTHRFQLTDEMAQEFRTTFNASMENHYLIEGKTPKIKKFTDPSLIDSDELYSIEKNTLPELDGLIDDLKMHNDASPIQELKNMEKAQIYCLEIAINDNTIFAFAPIDNFYINDTQKHILAEFKKDKINKIEKNLILFSKNISCVYLTKTQSLLIINSKNTSKMLSFSDQFKKTAKAIIQNEWTIVNIPPDSLEDVFSNNTNNQTLIKLNKSEKLKNKIEHYEKYNNFCTLHNDLDLKRLTIVQNKLIITKSKDLEIAIHVSDNTLVEGVLEHDDFSLALRRKPIIKK